MKRIIYFISTVIIICSLFAITGCSNNQQNSGFMRAEDSPDGYAAVYLPDGGAIKIVQLTDIHLEYFLGTDESLWHTNGIAGDNASTIAMLDKMLAALEPDLIIITGDALRTWTRDNFTEYRQLAEIFESRNIPWMPIFGNHEFEYSCEAYQHTPEQLAEALIEYPHCLMSKGDCADGVGNYFVNIKDKNQNIIYTLCALDCVFDRKYDTGGIAEGWSYIRTDAQIEWYERHIRAISALQYGKKSAAVIPSMAFMHTPVPEVLTAWESAWNGGNPTAAYHYGRLLTGKSTYQNYMGEDAFFNKAVELGSTKAMFFGHHHDNDFSVDYQGIRLTAGQMSTNNMDYRIGSTLSGLKFTEYDFTRLLTYGDNRGVTEIALTASGEFTITPRYARVVCEDYVCWATDYDAVIQKLIKRGITVTIE
ncbi:MAG: hypothetical protein EOM87_00370 [Clostridia bacterium]|nr:hypothetical protein [Clostridia bacterium]